MTHPQQPTSELKTNFLYTFLLNTWLFHSAVETKKQIGSKNRRLDVLRWSTTSIIFCSNILPELGSNVARVTNSSGVATPWAVCWGLYLTHQFNRYLAIPKHIRSSCFSWMSPNHDTRKKTGFSITIAMSFSQEQRFSSIDLSARSKKMFQRWSRTQRPHSCSGESFSERDAARVPSPSERLGVSCHGGVGMTGNGSKLQ